MNQNFVENLSISPEIERKNIYKEAKDLIDGKCYNPLLLDYCFLCFFEANDAYRTDLSSSNWEFKVELANKKYLIHFDVENLYHLFGLSKESLRNAVIINNLLKEIYNKNLKENGFNVSCFKGFKIFDKLNCIFQRRGNDIKQYDCNINNKNESKLNWDKIAFKLFCFLNIGELSCGETIFYHTKDSILFERKLISSSANEEEVLLIEFSPETKGSYIYNPVSIRIETRTNTKRYEFGNAPYKKTYTLFKGIKKGYTTIDKRRV